MYVIADLQLHSRFSRAVSKAMTLPFIAQWARIKGIGLVATGDWTHPMWFREIQRDLEEVGNGLLKLKDDVLAGSSFDSLRRFAPQGKRKGIYPEPSGEGLENLPAGKAGTRRLASLPFFLLATEVSCIYSQAGKGRRIHILIWVPSIASAEKINKEMTKKGCNLLSDGRPIIGLSAIQVAELVLTVEPKALVIPAHAWTPWFSLYGSMSGFDSIDEAFGPFAKNIYAVETGLSSNPSMNWRIKELDNRSILSFSDAHSGPKLGREATVFEVPEGELSYEAIYSAIAGLQPNTESRMMNHGKGLLTHNSKFSIHNSKIAYTIEFYPEEGKYHWSGHRTCNIRWGPEETKKNGNMCPVCGKKLVQGVEQRVEELAGRSEEALQMTNVQCQTRLPASSNRGEPDGQVPNGNTKIHMHQSKAFPDRPSFVMLVPLQEIIAEAIGSPVTSVKVQPIYEHLVSELGSEFSVLMQSSISSISRIAGERTAEGIDKVRKGDIVIEPGYDGVFGKVKIWREGEKSLVDTSKEQLAMFS